MGQNPGGWNLPGSRVTWPEVKCSSIRRRCIGNLGRVNICACNCLLVDQSSPNFLVQRGRDGSRSSLLSIFSMSIHSRYIRDQSLKLP